MTVNIFLMLLGAFSVITSGIVEIIKGVFGEKCKSYNLVALMVGLFVGIFGLYSYNTLIEPGHIQAIVYVLMGIATAGTSMLGYDKVKQMIEQFKK